MKIIADKLEELDHYLNEKKESEKWLIILMVAGVIGYLLYIYILPYAQDRFEHSVVEKQKLEKLIAEERGYLRSITVNGDKNYYVRTYKNKIKEKKHTIERYNKKIAMLNENFRKLSEILFNQKSWSNFLESISERANVNEVELLELTNNYVKQKISFGHVLEIGIKCTGTYPHILNFINDIEQSKLVTDIYETLIYTTEESGDGVIAEIKISVWGVNH